jgi:hypothetical protein
MIPRHSRQPPRFAQNTASDAQTAPLGNANTLSATARSDTLARRALGFALDSSVTMPEAAARLLELAASNTTVLELARARILRSAPRGVISSNALGAMDIALSDARATRIAHTANAKANDAEPAAG